MELALQCSSCGNQWWPISASEVFYNHAEWLRYLQAVGEVHRTELHSGSTVEIHGNPWNFLGFFGNFRVYGPIWAPYGPIWAHIGPYGPIWALMGPYGPIWAHKGPYGPIWAYMGPYGPIWGPYGPIYPKIPKKS